TLFRSIVSVFLCFTNCKEKGYYTGINEIDKKYKFQYKHIVEEDSLYPRMELFCNKTLKDSIYTIGTKEENGYKIRIRGWGFNQKRVGDWYYEKIYNDGMVITDSIINYIVFCDKNPINTSYIQLINTTAFKITQGIFLPNGAKRFPGLAKNFILSLGLYRPKQDGTFNVRTKIQNRNVSIIRKK